MSDVEELKSLRKLFCSKVHLKQLVGLLSLSLRTSTIAVDLNARQTLQAFRNSQLFYFCKKN